jgi:NADP-dependent 3-hydroxy acid dehydrogenase YdfG
MNVQEKDVLVTGASLGVGEATARLPASKGSKGRPGGALDRRKNPRRMR